MGRTRPPHSPDGHVDQREGWSQEAEDRREGLRQAIVDALALELDRTSARTAGRLAAAGALGAACAVGSVALFSGDALEDGHGWLLAACAAAWAGILVVCLDVVLLRIRVQRLPIAHSCRLALVGLALAASAAWLCHDSRDLAGWRSTPLGSLAGERWGPGSAAFCLGVCSALLVGSGAALIAALAGCRSESAPGAGIVLFLVLLPALVLETATLPGTFLAGSAGLFVGCLAGVALGRWSADRLLPRVA